MSKRNSYEKYLQNITGVEVKKLGTVESLRLKIAGHMDGRKGLPNCTDGHWNSAFIHREINAYEERCSHIWELLQLKNADQFVRLGELMDSIKQKKLLLKHAQKEVGIAMENENRMGIIRKIGEEKLNDNQIRVRRMNEQDDRLEPYRRQIGVLEGELKSMLEEVSGIRYRLVEEYNTTIMICKRIKNHTLQRLDVYWDASFHKHPDKASMPTIPNVSLSVEAEEVYTNIHKTLLSTTNSLYGKSVEETVDEEVA